MTHWTQPIGANPLNVAYQRHRLNAQQAEQTARIARETGQDTEPHANAHLPNTRNAAGIPLQIIAGGHPIIGMQRLHWRPDQSALR